jgi:hypothetical protein
MDVYHIWFNLKDSHRDLDFCEALETYMAFLRERDMIEGHRLTRRKLGFGPVELGEYHLAIDVRDLAQLDAAFQMAATRAAPVEGPHAAVYSKVKDVRFALYRDFPDPVRKRPAKKRSGKPRPGKSSSG